MTSQPLVSVVTPVYNGAAYLAECIESVQRQGYGNYEHVILNNASKDDTRAIAESYARRDRRIRVITNEATLPIIENWNRSMRLISDASAYCKVLHADDTLYPHCLEEMMRVALAHPSVGLVGSLRQRGEEVECGGLPADREAFPGVEIARLFLAQKVFSLAPSSGLIRADLVRARYPAFYPTQFLHADLAAYFDLLDRVDYGFVHQLLCFSRKHETSVTSTVAERNQTLMREWLVFLRDYGPRYFNAAELAELERAHLRRYYRLLVRGAVTGRGGSFLRYHLEGLKAAKRVPNAFGLSRAVAAEVAAAISNPGKLYHVLSGRQPPRPPREPEPPDVPIAPLLSAAQDHPAQHHSPPPGKP